MLGAKSDHLLFGSFLNIRCISQCGDRALGAVVWMMFAGFLLLSPGVCWEWVMGCAFCVVAFSFSFPFSLALMVESRLGGFSGVYHPSLTFTAKFWFWYSVWCGLTFTPTLSVAVYMVLCGGGGDSLEYLRLSASVLTFRSGS